MIENELKYVLHPESFSHLLRIAWDSRGAGSWGVPGFICQTYMDSQARVRKTVKPAEEFSFRNWRKNSYHPLTLIGSDAVFTYEFTYKIATLDSKVIEINSQILPDIYEQVIGSIPSAKPLYKLRHTYYNDPDEERWDIDLFYSRSRGLDQMLGFVLGIAECEMPPGRTRPNNIPKWLESMICRRIGRDEPYFFNFSLANSLEFVAEVEYGRRVLIDSIL